MDILNTWQSDATKKEYFKNLKKPVFTIGKYSVYKQFDKCYLYTYKNIAFTQLCGLNKDHLKAIAERKEPTDTQSKFLYYRSLESLNKGMKLLVE